MSGFEELMKKKAVALKYDAQKNGAPVIVACLLYTSCSSSQLQTVPHG